MHFRLLTCLILLFASCGGATTTQPAEPLVPEQPNAEVNSVDRPDPATTDFKVRFETTAGPFVVQVHRDWAPLGAERFYQLVKDGYYTDVAFFRAISGFMVQFGIHGDPAMNTQWRDANINDDPVVSSNVRGSVTFAMGGPNTRTTQLFINFVDNTRLDEMGFAPFAEVVEGMSAVDAINTEYGEGAPSGQGPDQGRLQDEGNAYLREQFPGLDYIQSASIVD